MMAGNPNWRSMDNGMHSPQPQFVYGSSSALSPSMSNPSLGADHHYLHPNGQDFPVRSWSQLLMAGSAINNNNDEEENCQLIFGQYNYCDDNEFMRSNKLFFDSPWRHNQRGPISSPTSCITALSNNILSFSSTGNPQNHQDHSSECNSRGTGGASKKARVTQASPHPALKVRKEKLGDRITTLHNLVSPFGKTDTASVLSEANGYIRFLHGQIEALSSPYMRNASAAASTRHSAVQESNCLLPDEPGQEDSQCRSGAKDLTSRGLCLVPTSCTPPIENEIEADYWAPTAFNFSWRQV